MDPKFLAERKQVVVVEGERSDSINVELGVPQGSVPSLFLFYINDMPEGIRSRVKLFADDTIVYLTITSEIRVITKLPNSEQSYKGKVKTHNYINRQNRSTTGKL